MVDDVAGTATFKTPEDVPSVDLRPYVLRCLRRNEVS